MGLCQRASKAHSFRKIPIVMLQTLVDPMLLVVVCFFHAKFTVVVSGVGAPLGETEFPKILLSFQL